MIKVKDLSIGYENKVVARELNFTIDCGDYLCIVGENGSGKSTLMKTLLGLQKPISGSINFDGGLTFKDIGYLPQQTIVQKDFPASVFEVVLSGFQGKKGFFSFYNKREREKARRFLAKLGLSQYERKCYRELSGGQQQRVLLARALCASETILFLDEPVAGLDQNAMSEMYSIIKELNDNGVTIIMITHDLGVSLEYAKHILHIGKDIFFGSLSDYMGSPISNVFNRGKSK